MNLANWQEELAHLAFKVEFERRLSSLTSLGIGGPAQAWARPDNLHELKMLLAICHKYNQPYLVIGGGTNLLFTNEGFAGLIIALGAEFRELREIGSDRLYAGAAVTNACALDFALQRSLAGLECLTGVPGSLGGSTIMNAGAGGKNIGALVQSICIMNADGTVREEPKEHFEFAYRSLKGLPAGAIITGLVLQLKADNYEAINERITEILKHRRQTQPKGHKSAGCFFKNPKGDSAGRLIDDCGLKGVAVGGAQVSEVHANFLINQGGASFDDMWELVKLVKGEVANKHRINLELEVQIIAQDGGRREI